MNSEQGPLPLEQSSGVNVYSYVDSSTRLQTGIGSKPEEVESTHQDEIRVLGSEHGFSCASSLPSTVHAGVASRSGGSGNQDEQASVATTSSPSSTPSAAGHRSTHDISGRRASRLWAPIVSQQTAARPRATRGVSNSPVHALALGLPAIEAGHGASGSKWGASDSMARGPADDAQTGSTVKSYLPRPRGEMLRTHSDTSHETGSGTVSGANDVAYAGATAGGYGRDARAVCGGAGAGRGSRSPAAGTDDTSGCNGIRDPSTSMAEAVVVDSLPSSASATPNHPQVAASYTAVGIDSGAYPDQVASTSGGLRCSGERPAGMSRPPPASGAGADDLQGSAVAIRPRVKERWDVAASSTGVRATVGADGRVNGSDDEYAPCPEGRQPAFEAAKRRVALYPYEQEERRVELEKIGRQFHADVSKALDGFPEVEMVWRGTDPVGFSDSDITAIFEQTGLESAANVGGRAGGIKFRHRGMGLFLKFAFDDAEKAIYHSNRMAAKAAKREAAASRWVHAMDSVHVSTPLLECVDIPVKLTRSRGSRVIRAQVFAHAAVSPATLRVGSPDARKTMHTDDEQMVDVVEPLARWFGIRPYSPCVEPRSRLVRHYYVEGGEVLRGARGAKHVLDYLESTSMDKDVLGKIKLACSHKNIPLDDDFKHQRGSEAASTEIADQTLSKMDMELAKAVNAAIDSSGICLDYRKPKPDMKHVVASGPGDVPVLMRLPFDVEVHQLDSGQRVVLDTHRLLIPDVAWMDWMESDEAKPRVWGVVQAGPDDAEVHQFKLPEFAHNSENGTPDLEELSKILNGSAARKMELFSAGDMLPASVGEANEVSLEFKKEDMKVDAARGCVTIHGHNADRSHTVTAIVSCPRWYYCGSAALTCLLPPEAAHCIRQIEGPEWKGLCPDSIAYRLGGNDDAHSENGRAKVSIEKLCEKAKYTGPDALRCALAREKGRFGGLGAISNPVACRRVLKATMHSLGLGLRHTRLLLQSRAMDDVLRAAILSSLISHVRVKHSAAASMEGILALATLHATKGIKCPTHICRSIARGHFGGNSSASRSYVSGLCAGIALAVPSGLHTCDRKTAVKSLVCEYAHVLRVGGTGACSCRRDQASDFIPKIPQLPACDCLPRSGYSALLEELDNMCKNSAGLGPLRLTLCVNRRDAWQHLGVQEGAQGKRGSDFANALHRMAKLFESRGRFYEATELHKQCLKIRQDELGKDHRESLLEYRNVCTGLKKQGKYDKAMEVYKECVQVLEDDEHRANTYFDMANCYELQGKYADAMEYYYACLKIQTRATGEYHSSCARTRQCMAVCMEKQGKYGEAMEQHHQCLYIQELVVGKEHPDYASTLNSMAVCLESHGKCREAMQAHEQCLRRRYHALGKAHPDYALTLRNMAVCFESLGDFGEAMKHFRQCKSVRERALGEAHPDCIITLNDMAICYEKQGKYEEAIGLFKHCLQSQEYMLGREHRDYLNTLNNMAKCLMEHGEYGEAMEKHQHCLQIRKRVLGKDHPHCAVSLDNMAVCLVKQGKYREAVHKYRDCLYIRELKLGRHHPDYASTFDRTAFCVEKLDPREEATKLHKKWLQIRRPASGGVEA